MTKDRADQPNPIEIEDDCIDDVDRTLNPLGRFYSRCRSRHSLSRRCRSLRISLSHSSVRPVQSDASNAAMSAPTSASMASRFSRVRGLLITERHCDRLQ